MASSLCSACQPWNSVLLQPQWSHPHRVRHDQLCSRKSDVSCQPGRVKQSFCVLREHCLPRGFILMKAGDAPKMAVPCLHVIGTLHPADLLTWLSHEKEYVCIYSMHAEACTCPSCVSKTGLRHTIPPGRRNFVHPCHEHILI